MIFTCVTHHPGRPKECLFRTVRSLTKATEQMHVIDLRIQGGLPDGRLNVVRDIVLDGNKDSPIKLVVTYYEENTGQVRPLVDSVSEAKKLGAEWWAKLDDDGDVPTGAWDLLIEALERVGPLAACAQANPLSETHPRVMKETPTSIKIVDGFLDRGRIKNRVAWHVVECVGDGCSVFRLEVFEGCYWDERFETSADNDLAVQFKRAGYVSLLCDPPKAGHYHKECSPLEYDKVRYDSGALRRTVEVFEEKWGKKSAYLASVRPRRFS